MSVHPVWTVGAPPRRNPSIDTLSHISDDYVSSVTLF